MRKQTKLSLIALGLIVTLQFAFGAISASAVTTEPALNWGIADGDDYEFRVRTGLEYELSSDFYTELNAYITNMTEEDVNSLNLIADVIAYAQRDMDVKVGVNDVYSANVSMTNYHDKINASLQARNHDDTTYRPVDSYVADEMEEIMWHIFNAPGNVTRSTQDEVQDAINEMRTEVTEEDFSNMEIEEWAYVNTTEEFDLDPGLPFTFPQEMMSVPTDGGIPLFIPQELDIGGWYQFGQSILDYMGDNMMPSPAISDDSFEENDILMDAAAITTGTHSNLYLFDDDYYVISVPANKYLNVQLMYDDNFGDIYLELFNSTEESAGYEYGYNGITFEDTYTETAQNFYIHVEYGATGVAYEMAITITDSPQMEYNLDLLAFLDFQDQWTIYSDEKAFSIAVTVDESSFPANSEALEFFDEIEEETGIIDPSVSWHFAIEYTDAGILDTLGFYVDFDSTVNLTTLSGGDIVLDGQTASLGAYFTIQNFDSAMSPPTQEDISDGNIGDAADPNSREASENNSPPLIPGFPLEIVGIITISGIVMIVLKKRK